MAHGPQESASASGSTRSAGLRPAAVGVGSAGFIAAHPAARPSSSPAASSRRTLALMTWFPGVAGRLLLLLHRSRRGDRLGLGRPLLGRRLRLRRRLDRQRQAGPGAQLLARLEPRRLIPPP